MTIVFVFRNGFELKMKCKKFTLERNGLGKITGYSASGISENKPLELDFDELLCIYRVLSDEGGAEE